MPHLLYTPSRHTQIGDIIASLAPFNFLISLWLGKTTQKLIDQALLSAISPLILFIAASIGQKVEGLIS